MSLKFVKKFAAKLFPKLATRYKWQKIAQVGHYNFQINNEWRQSEKFVNDYIELFEYWGYQRNNFVDKNVLDLGSGSKLRTKFFTEAKIFAIEPLGNKFLKELKWSDLSQVEKLYSVPAEKFIKEIEGKIDIIFSINVLDHCYDVDKILSNCKKYLRNNGVACFSFDIHEAHADHMHPIDLDKEKFENILKNNNFIVEKIINGLPNGPHYGHGETITYFVR